MKNIAITTTPTTAEAIAIPSSTPSGIAELVEPVLVDPEVVGQLVEGGDADRLLEPLRVVSEVLDERPPVDRDPRRQIWRLVEQPVDVGLLAVPLLDHDRHVLEPARELGRQCVECSPYVILEPGHRRSRERSAPAGPSPSGDGSRPRPTLRTE